MSAISTSFNRFLLLLLLNMSIIPAAFSQLPQLNQEQMRWLGQRIFENECNQKFECLSSWNQGEDFPSLGIGHFIWYRAGQNERFEETFPALLQHYKNSKYPIPQWLSDLPEFESPWLNREQFLAERNSIRMLELRDFLATSTEIQIEFIAQRLTNSTSFMFAGLDSETRQAVEMSFYSIANSQAPYGLYALIDYVHFKGSGTVPSERYQGQGWGLLQVLIELQHREPNLDNFVAAATSVLERRVENAPRERREERWIAGWRNRLQSYLPSK